MNRSISNKGRITLPRPVWAILIKSMTQMGYSLGEIEKIFGLTRYHVHVLTTELESFSTDLSLKIQDRTRIDFTDDHFAVINQVLEENPQATKSDILLALKKTFPGFDCSIQTLTRRLEKEGYYI